MTGNYTGIVTFIDLKNNFIKNESCGTGCIYSLLVLSDNSIIATGLNDIIQKSSFQGNILKKGTVPSNIHNYVNPNQCKTKEVYTVKYPIKES